MSQLNAAKSSDFEKQLNVYKQMVFQRDETIRRLNERMIEFEEK